MVRAFAFGALALLLPSVGAADLKLGLPVDCDLGGNCFIQQFVDHDKGKAVQDYTCGGLSYDGHKGTDFGIVSFAQMRRGIDVIAAAPGIVTGTRDGMPDTGYNAKTARQIKGKECGNGVMVRHDGGWETQYCHMRQGSIRVRKGQRVTRQTRLGKVGFSGHSEFPHLHLSVRKDGQVVDPFDPDGKIACGRADQHTLWKKNIPYQAGALLSSGFAPAVPAYEQVKQGKAAHPTLSATAPAMVVWGFAFGGQKGDKVLLQITGPDGDLFQHRAEVSKNQAQFFRAAGRKRKSTRWPKGRYVGTVQLIRNGAIISTRTTETHIR